MTTLIWDLTVTVSRYCVNAVGLLSHFNREYSHGLTLGKAAGYVDVA